MNMKRYISGLFFAIMLPLVFASCDDDEDKVPSVIPTETGTVTDMDGNEYHWVRIGKLDWMTENLHCGLPFS